MLRELKFKLMAIFMVVESKAISVKLFFTGVLWLLFYYLAIHVFSWVGGKILTNEKGYLFLFHDYPCGALMYSQMFTFNAMGYNMFLTLKKVYEIHQQIKKGEK